MEDLDAQLNRLILAHHEEERDASDSQDSHERSSLAEAREERIAPGRREEDEDASSNLLMLSFEEEDPYGNAVYACAMGPRELSAEDAVWSGPLPVETVGIQSRFEVLALLRLDCEISERGADDWTRSLADTWRSRFPWPAASLAARAS
jgi:hypothetical protein